MYVSIQILCLYVYLFENVNKKVFKKHKKHQKPYKKHKKNQLFLPDIMTFGVDRAYKQVKHLSSLCQLFKHSRWCRSNGENPLTFEMQPTVTALHPNSVARVLCLQLHHYNFYF